MKPLQKQNVPNPYPTKGEKAMTPYEIKQQATAQEIAESFVNGNISWVKGMLQGRRRMTLRVLLVLEEMGNPHNSVESFKRIMSA